MRDSVPALIKQLEWCEDDCGPIIDALARAGDPAALEPLSAKLADPVLADTAAGAMATIATNLFFFFFFFFFFFKKKKKKIPRRH